MKQLFTNLWRLYWLRKAAWAAELAEFYLQWFPAGSLGHQKGVEEATVSARFYHIANVV